MAYDAALPTTVLAFKVVDTYDGEYTLADVLVAPCIVPTLTARSPAGSYPVNPLFTIRMQLSLETVHLWAKRYPHTDNVSLAAVDCLELQGWHRNKELLVVGHVDDVSTNSRGAGLSNSLYGPIIKDAEIDGAALTIRE